MISHFCLNLLASPNSEPQSASAESSDQSDGWQPSAVYPGPANQPPFPIPYGGGNPPYIQRFICVHPCVPMGAPGS